MAAYTVARAKHATTALDAVTSAPVVDTVTLTGVYPKVEVINRDGSTPIYFRVDATNPAVAGDDSLVVPPGKSVVVEHKTTRAGTEIRLISAAAAAYSVQGVQQTA